MTARLLLAVALSTGACAKPTPTRLTTAKDSDNYYLTRANALEDNVRLYHVVNGDRQEFASADLAVTAGQWHTLEVTARGTKLGLSWDGRPVLDASDATFTNGKIGLLVNPRLSWFG